MLQSKSRVLVEDPIPLECQVEGLGFFIVLLSKDRKEINDNTEENNLGSCVENSFAF